jgi:hypothetical protein
MANSTSNSRLTRALNLFGPTDDLGSPLWTLRVAPLIALVALVLAETLWPTGFAHGLCLGMAIGQLAVLLLNNFLITDVSYKNNAQPSDVQDLRITPTH